MYVCVCVNPTAAANRQVPPGAYNAAVQQLTLWFYTRPRLQRYQGSSRHRLGAHLSSALDLGDTWPTATMSLDYNCADLVAHREEFERKLAFAYTVFSSDDKDLCVGCIYINPSQKIAFDAQIWLWVRNSHAHLDGELYRQVTILTHSIFSVSMVLLRSHLPLQFGQRLATSGRWRMARCWLGLSGMARARAELRRMGGARGQACAPACIHETRLLWRKRAKPASATAIAVVLDRARKASILLANLTPGQRANSITSVGRG